MKVLLYLVLLALILRALLNIYQDNLGARIIAEKTNCFLLYSVIVFLAAFRGSSVGADTLSYIDDYNSMVFLSFSEIADRYEGYIGFYYISKIFSLLRAPLWVWFGFVEIVYVSAIARLINKYSRDKIYSIIVFLVSGLFLFSLAGLKQTFAMGLALHSFLDLIEKKFVRCLCLLAISYLCHPVALVILIAFFLYYLKDTNVFPFVIVALLGTVLIGRLSLMSFFVDLLGNEHFDSYLNLDTSYTRSTLYCYLLLLASTILFIRDYFNQSGTARFELGCLLVACSFQFLASYSPALFRMSLCFTPFFTIYLPGAFDARVKKDFIYVFFKYAALAGLVFFQLYASRSFVYTFSI